MRYDLVSGPEASKVRKSQDKLDAPPDVAEGGGWEGNLSIVIGQGGEVIKLPHYIMLENNKVMRLRRFEAVMRRHKFNPERYEHEFSFLKCYYFPHGEMKQSYILII